MCSRKEVTEITEREELKYPERDEWNIEELNFLAKRMESFNKREQSQFDAAVSIFRPKTVEALINYTYNLPRITLISDFSSPTEIGKRHVINRKQAMSFDEMASTGFAKIGKELVTSRKGVPTAYGVLFVNEDIPFEPVYDGRHFPAFDYKGSRMTVKVSCKGKKEYTDIIPDGFDVITLPAAKYLMFQGEPLKEDYCQAIEALQLAMERYDPSTIGYAQNKTNPRIQLEPRGGRGYIELRAIQ